MDPLLLIFFGLLAAAPVESVEVVAFGDSWAEQGASHLQHELQAAGFELTVDNRGAGGTTAEHWATRAPSALPEAVSEYPGVRWVYLSLGGNDVLTKYPRGRGAAVAAENERYLRRILGALFAQHPTIQVVLFGYDFINLERSPECRDFARATFGADWTTERVNQILLTDVGAVMERIASESPNISYIPLWGTLQRAGGLTEAPLPALPSPATLLNDCVHPTPTGYRILYDALIAAWWSAPRPVADFIDDGGPACPGHPLIFVDRSLNASERRWWVRGEAAGGAKTLTLTIPSTESFLIALTAFNGAWQDQVSRVIDGSSCREGTDGGVRDLGPPDLGAEASSSEPSVRLPSPGNDAGGGCAVARTARVLVGLLVLAPLLHRRQRRPSGTR